MVSLSVSNKETLISNASGIRTYAFTNLNASDDVVKTSNGVQKVADAKIVPWTIKNKYYTADVHFKVIPLEDWVHSHLESVPAIIYAFSVDDDVCPLFLSHFGRS